MIELSLIDTPNQEFNAVLNEQNCTIQLRFINKIPYFSLWLDDSLICQNVIVLPQQPILIYNTHLFNGNFWIVDTTSPADNQSSANYEELSTRFKLYYLTNDEIEELEE